MKHCQPLYKNILNLPFINPHNFFLQTFGSYKLVCHTAGDQCCTIPTDAMPPCIIAWHCHLTVHAEGMAWLENLIQCHFLQGNLCREIWKQLGACDVCAKMKKNSPKEGQLAPCKAQNDPWLEAHIDLIGSWELKSQGVSPKFEAMTIVDPVTNLIETAQVMSTKSVQNACTFKNIWSLQCPKQDKVVKDNGPEFNGKKWEFMLMDWRIRKGRNFSHTPTANAVANSSHPVISQILCTMLHGAMVKTKAELEAAFNDACAVNTRVVHSVSNMALKGIAPGTSVFERNVKVDVPVLTEILAVSANQQLQTDARPMCENQQCTNHEHNIGQQVCVNNHFSSTDELKQAWAGPFLTLCVHANGTVTIQCSQMHEQISVPCIKPVLAQELMFPAKWSRLSVSCIARQFWCSFGTVFFLSVVE